MVELKLRKPLERAVLEVNLTVTKEFKLRMLIGKHLLICAAKVLGAEIKFVTPTPPATYGTECKVDGVFITADAGKFTDAMRRVSNALETAAVNTAKHDITMLSRPQGIEPTSPWPRSASLTQPTLSEDGKHGFKDEPT